MQIVNSYWCDPEFFYKIRFDKKCNFSLEPFWQKATHLITSCKHYKTESMNFNFIFSNSFDQKLQWEILYKLLPFLLIHTYHVVETLFKSFAGRKNQKNDITDLRVMLGFFLVNREQFRGNKISRTIKENFSEIGLDKVNCPKCNKFFIFDKKIMEIIYREGIIKCINCEVEINLLKHNLSKVFSELFNKKENRT